MTASVHSNPMSRQVILAWLPAFTAAIILAILCGFASPARAVHEEWNQRWDDPAHQTDMASKVAVDDAGNVYVAGYSASPIDYGHAADYCLIKYGPDGTELWNRHYDGPGHGADHVTGLALDSAGDAYITGYSVGYGTGSDYATLKYDPDGNRLWLRRYDGMAHNYDAAYAIAVDAAGDAYVTGLSVAASQSWDYLTLKYAADGQTLWTRRYDGPSRSTTAPAYNAAYAIAVDEAGNAYVTGASSLLSDVLGYTCTTIKYSANGAERWIRDFAFGTGLNNSGLAIVAARDGSLYVAGRVQQERYGILSYLVLKYDRRGNELWHCFYNQNPQTSSVASALAVDTAGNVLVTGSTGTVKYDSDGLQQWAVDDEGGYGAAVVTDEKGDVYVAGNSYLAGGVTNSSNGNNDTAGSFNFSLLKYGVDGSLHWGRFFNGPSGGVDSATALTVDQDDNVYVTGISDQVTIRGLLSGGNMRTVKYSQ